MADDAATVEQLRAELWEARAEIEAGRGREAALDAEVKHQDRAFAATLERQAATMELLRVVAGESDNLVRGYPFLRRGSTLTEADWSAESRSLSVELKHIRR